MSSNPERQLNEKEEMKDASSTTNDNANEVDEDDEKDDDETSSIPPPDQKENGDDLDNSSSSSMSVQNNNGNINGQPSTPPASSAISPPGMKLRSGRKKRRRSRDTTGLTPPSQQSSAVLQRQEDSSETMSIVKRTTKRKRGDEDEDSNMANVTDEDDDEGKLPRKRKKSNKEENNENKEKEKMVTEQKASLQPIETVTTTSVPSVAAISDTTTTLAPSTTTAKPVENTTNLSIPSQQARITAPPPPPAPITVLPPPPPPPTMATLPPPPLPRTAVAVGNAQIPPARWSAVGVSEPPVNLTKQKQPSTATGAAASQTKASGVKPSSTTNIRTEAVESSATTASELEGLSTNETQTSIFSDTLDGRRNGLLRHLLHSASSLLESFTDKVQTTVTNAIRPEAERVEVVHHEGEEKEVIDLIDDKEEEMDEKVIVLVSNLSSTKFWVVILILLYGLLSIMGIFHSSKTIETIPPVAITNKGTTENFLDASDQTVKRKEQEEEDYEDEEEEEEPEIIIKEEEEIVQVEDIIEEDDPELLQKHLQFLTDAKLLQRYNDDSRLVSALIHNDDAKEQETHASDTVAYSEQMVHNVANQLPDMDQTLLMWEKALEQAEMAISEALDNNEYSEKARVALERLESVSLTPVRSSMFDSYSVQVPGEGCDGLDHMYVVHTERTKKAAAKTAKYKDVLRKDQLYNTQASLKGLAATSATKIIEESSMGTHWMEEGVDASWLQYKADHDADDSDDDNAEEDYDKDMAGIEASKLNANGMTKDKIDAEIKKEVDVELADGTGKFDYASLLGGASVVRSGRRRTSLSLVDDLPLFNKILSAGKMRFYGHGAEAALAPTYPKDSLGQCWSFEPEDISNSRKTKHRATKDDGEVEKTKEEIADDMGAYASLTVRLSSAVYVSSVVLEHPSKYVSSDLETAVQDVRVLGFEDEDGSGDAWELGGFQYDIDSKEWSQEFDVATEVEGERVPPLRSITLAIDSNWGSDYSCLYRFRVHGTEKV